MMAINEFASMVASASRIVMANNKTFKDAAALTKGFIMGSISIKCNHLSSTRGQEHDRNSRRGREAVEVECGDKRDCV